MARTTGTGRPPSGGGSRGGQVARRARPPRRERSELTRRILVAVPALVLAWFAIFFDDRLFVFAAIMLGLVCLHELFAMYSRMRPVRLGGMLGLVAIALAAYFGGERQVMLALLAAVAVTFVIAIGTPAHLRLTPGLALTVFGIVWIALPIAHAVMLIEMPHGEEIIVNVLIGTFVGDSVAYSGGRAFGKRKLAPAISPNKTVEGLLLGMGGAILGVWVAGLYEDWLGHGEALLLGLAVAIAAPLGDLFESRVKRDAGVKDSGRLFGAHGGALDRLDAVLFTLVCGYYMWLALS